MSCSRCSTASSCAARASAILPSGMSSRPVRRRAVRLRVAAQVRHRPVVERHHRLLLRVLEHLRLEREHGAHGLVRVVVVPELDHVGAVVVLVDDLLEDRRRDVGVARAVEAEDDLVAVVDGAELGRRGEDVEQVVDARPAASGSTLARLTAASEPACRSASISARVISTSEPSPSRVGMRCAIDPPVVPRAGRSSLVSRITNRIAPDDIGGRAGVKAAAAVVARAAATFAQVSAVAAAARPCVASGASAGRGARESGAPPDRQGARVEPRIVTRQGDGSAVALTRSELRSELEEGTRAAAARARAPELRADELDHLLDIFASRARFTAVDIGDEVVLSFDGSGTPQQGSRVDALLQYEQCLGADTCELYHIDYSYKAVKTDRRRRAAGDEGGAGARHHPGALRRPAGPRPLLAPGRAVRQLVGAAAGDAHRRGARGAGGGGRARRRGHGPRRRRAVGGRRRRHQLRHRRRRRRRRPAGDAARRRAPARRRTRPWASWSAWPAEVVLGTHGAARVPRHATGRPQAGGPVPGGAGGRRHHLRAGRQRQHQPHGRLERRPGAHLHEAVHGRRADPRARQRGHGRRRRADERLQPRRRRLALLARLRRHPARSTACRWAPATSSACRSRTPSPRG